MSDALFDAIFQADAARVAELISKNVNVNALNEDGDHAIEIACSMEVGIRKSHNFFSVQVQHPPTLL